MNLIYIKTRIKKSLRYWLDMTLHACFFSRYLFVEDKPSAPVWISIKKALLIRRINAWRARKKGFIEINYDNMKKYKNSDTLFNLGSGPSINDIDDIEWEMIKSCDSFAFNSFYAHPFVPTYYHSEPSKNPINREIHKECYSLKSIDFKKIPFILNFNHLSKESDPNFTYISNCYVSIPISVSLVDSEQHFAEMIDFFNIHYGSSMESMLIHHRASIFLAISFAVMMRYKKIVLAGVDMFDMEYFFFNVDMYPGEVARKLREAKLEVNKKCQRESTKNIHRVADPGMNSLPVDKAVVIFNEKYLKPRGIHLSLLSKKTLLYPRIGEFSKEVLLNSPT